MKHFLAKVLLLAVLAAGIVAALALFAYSAPVSKRFGPEVFRAIRVCTSAAPQARTLVLGDSVANQVFGTGPAMPADVAVATCNQVVTPLGNRILLDRWLALNPQAEDVVYVSLPGTLANDGSPEFTFHYLLFPFAEAGLFGGGLPAIVVENLRAMRDACAARGVRFRLAFPPVRGDRKPSAAYLARLADQLRDICPEIDGLVADLRVEPPEHFRDDVHLTRERLDEIRAGLRAGILEGKERP